MGRTRVGNCVEVVIGRAMMLGRESGSTGDKGEAGERGQKAVRRLEGAVGIVRQLGRGRTIAKT